MNILITGGAGFIGSHLAERLVLDASAQVTVIDNLSRGSRANLNPVLTRIRFIEGDIRDRVALERAIQGVDLIFHLAAQSSVMAAVRDPAATFSNNVAATFAVLECAQCQGVRRVVFTSSREVYGEPQVLPVAETAPLNPKNAYGASKAAAESYCRFYAANGLPSAILRLTNVYGPRDHGRVVPLFIERSLRQAPLTLYGGAQVLDFVWIAVVVDALVQAASESGSAAPVNVGSGRGCTLAHLARRVQQCAGSEVPLQQADCRSSEVVRFVSDIEQASRRFGLVRPNDPLEHLPRLVESARANLSPRLNPLPWLTRIGA